MAFDIEYGMPTRARGLSGPSQTVSVQIPIRLTPEEAKRIRNAANDANLSVSRYVAQAAVTRAASGRPTPAEAPSRLERRAKTLRRLRDSTPQDTPERAALAWAASFAASLNRATPPGAPPPGSARILSELAARRFSRWHTVVVGALNWGSKMAGWAESIVGGTPAPAQPSEEILPPELIAAAASLRWAYRAAMYRESGGGQSDAQVSEPPPNGALDRLQGLLFLVGRPK